MTSLSHVPTEEIRREAAALHELLAGSLWELELRPVHLGRGESPLVRAFWEEVGWDDRLLRDLGPPQLEASHRLARATLADYRRWGSPLEAAALPARYRLVQPDADGVGFAVTDESGGELDPPVIGLSADAGTAERIGESYLRYAANALIHAATRSWYQARISTEPPLAELARVQPFPHLAPGVRTLSEDLWLRPRSADAADPTDAVAIRSFDGLWRWLGGAGELRRLGISSLPGHRHPLPVSPDAVRAATGGWREIAAFPPAIAYRVGTLGEAPVIVQLGSSSTLASSAGHEQPVAAALVERGWLAPGR